MRAVFQRKVVVRTKDRSVRTASEGKSQKSNHVTLPYASLHSPKYSGKTLMLPT